MLSSRFFAAAFAALLLTQVSFGLSPNNPSVTSSFEFDDASGEFTLGSSPQEVTFLDGMAVTIGVFSLYHSGTHAWMITPGATGVASFDTPAKQIEFFARTQNAGTQSTITVFGTDGSVLGTFVPGDAGWTTVSVMSTSPQISHFTVAHEGGTGLIAIDDFSYCPNDVGDSWCIGDGGNQMGCTNCPCMNNAPAGATGGCLNSAATSLRLIAEGDLSVSLPSNVTSDLRFSAAGVPPGAFCILNSGDSVAPGSMANPCFGMNSGAQAAAFDGLRCAIMNTRRHGGRSADVNGDVGVTNNPWGGEGGPPVGIAVAGGGFVAGQTRFFQIINRDDAMAVCMRGLNTSQAIEITFAP